MNYLLALVTGIAISMVAISFMVRYAAVLGLMDQPDPRKVHSLPIPRVGGIGIVIGALIPVLVLEPVDQLIRAYLMGSLVLFGFGIWDDRSEIGHYPKFLGQILAVSILVFYGDFRVHSVPFLGHGVLHEVVAIPFTIVAITGVINAVNHSDGLDGLAGGIMLISLSAIALLFFLAGNGTYLIITLAVIGGLLGFLRFNTHPARIFMGDSGSQFLGYTLAFLVILLVERVDSEFSPAAVLLLFGLPIADILIVLMRRISGGSSWFRATRNHVHHRLLDLGFVHQQSVVIIYSVQLFLVVSAVLLRHKDDIFPLSLYLFVCTTMFVLIWRAEKKGWRAKQYDHSASMSLVNSSNLVRRGVVTLPRRFLGLAIPLYFVGASMWIERIPRDFASMSALLFFLLLIDTWFGSEPRSLMRRALVYITGIFVVYLGINFPPDWWVWVEPVNTAFFVFVVVSFAMAVKFSPRRRRVEFDVTAMDYLLVLLLLAGLVASGSNLIGNTVIAFVVEVAVIFYGCELVITESRERWNTVSLAALVTLLIFSIRGLLETYSGIQAI